MSGLNFPQRWIDWVEARTETANFLVLINGNPKGYFTSSNGLWQRDPISSFLFIIVIQALSGILKVACNNDLLEKIDIPVSNALVSLHFDDTLIFLKPTLANVINI